MAGVFPGELNLWKGDPERNTLRFIADRGFHGGCISPSRLTDPDFLAFLKDLHGSQGQVQSAHHGVDYLAPADQTAAELDSVVSLALKTGQHLPLAFLGLCVSGGGHRFDRTTPIEQQFSILSAALRPSAVRCADAGLPLVIENHGDYYVSDLVTLCAMTPGLELMLDTGNCFLIGERPDQIPDAAFPLVRATHWKDHHVFPRPDTLSFQLTGATLGEGAVGLDAIYQRLVTLHPDPASIRMLIEWVPDPEKLVLDCFDASLAYLEKLSGGVFSRSSNSHPAGL